MTHETTERLAVFLATEHDAVSNSPGGCPDENLWAQLETGLLSGDQRDGLLTHASECGSCRRRMSMIVAEWGEDISIGESTQAGRGPLILRIRPVHYAMAACVAIAVMAVMVFGPMGGQQADLPAGLTVARLTDTEHIGIVQRRVLSFKVDEAEDGERDAIVADLERRVASRPDDVEAWHRLGQAQIRLGKYAEAEQSYQQAIDLNPNRADLHNGLGMALFMRQQYEAALTAFGKAVSLDDTRVDAVLNQALTLEELQRTQEAIGVWERFVELAPDDPKAQEVERWLTILRGE